MRDDTLVHTQITVNLVMLLRKIRGQLEAKEMKKKRKRVRVTTKVICLELHKRCLEKQI